MNYPRPRDPDDESDLPWDGEEETGNEEDPPPAWLPASERQARREPPEEEADESTAPFVDFTEIPAWQKTHRYALQIARLSRTAPAGLQRHPALVNLRRQSYLAAVDIAYGHDEGYGVTRRRRHLDLCRRGLNRIHLCLSLIETARDLEILPRPSRRALFDQTIVVRDTLVHWMERLRRRP